MPPFSPILVRSGVLVLTETQVQNYSQTGKIGSKHPNVIFIYSSQCDFMQKKIKRNTKKNADFLCEFGSWAQKWRKIPPKTDHSIANCSILFIGMVYFIRYLVNLYVQMVQNIYGKGTHANNTIVFEWSPIGRKKTY